MNQSLSKHELLVSKWTKAVQLSSELSRETLPSEYVETNNLLTLLERKLSVVKSIALMMHQRGNQLTFSMFEGTLLGGLNNYRNDIDFDKNPTLYLNASKAIMERLTLLRHLLEIAFDYFTLNGVEQPLYLPFMESVYPDMMSWIHQQTDHLTET